MLPSILSESKYAFTGEVGRALLGAHNKEIGYDLRQAHPSNRTPRSLKMDWNNHLYSTLTGIYENVKARSDEMEEDYRKYVQ